MRTFTRVFVLMALCLPATFAEKKFALKDLPPEVQKTIEAELKGGEIKNIGKETEHGVSQYEVETMREGKHRDFNVDMKGALVSVEEETAIDSVPAVAKAAILTKVGDGKLGMVERATTKDGASTYEASYTTKAGKKHEVAVKSDGSETKY